MRRLGRAAVLGDDSSRRGEAMVKGSATERADEAPVVFTIGHSNHGIEAFISLLHGAGVTAVTDVRAAPFSRFAPQYNRAALETALAAAGIAYSFHGDALGGRPRSASGGAAAVPFEERAASPAFRSGLARVLGLAERHTVALMCAERDPLDCHRNILVARNLARLGARIRHILADGRIETGEDAERRLLSLTGEDGGGLFGTHADALDRAYRKRGKAMTGG